IVLDAKGTGPVVRTLSQTRLRLSGLTIEVRAEGGAAGIGIESGGDVVLDRCLLFANQAAPGVAAIRSEGLRFEASGCQFEGFEAPVPLVAYSGATATFRNCLFDRNRPDGSKLACAVAVDIRARPPRPGPTLRFDRCTISGYGLLAA